MKSEQIRPCACVLGGHYRVKLISDYIGNDSDEISIPLTSYSPDTRHAVVVVKQLESRPGLEGRALSDDGLSHGRVGVNENLWPQ